MESKSILKKIKNIKGIGFVAVGLIAGIALLLLPDSSMSQTETPASTKIAGQSASDYCGELEKKTESLILGLDGVSECKVVITLGYGYEYIYATDQLIDEASGAEGGSKSTEKKYVVITSDDGGEPILLREKMPTVLGVAVVAKSASYETQLKIINLLSALYDINSNKISVQA